MGGGLLTGVVNQFVQSPEIPTHVRGTADVSPASTLLSPMPSLPPFLHTTAHLNNRALTPESNTDYSLY